MPEPIQLRRHGRNELHRRLRRADHRHQPISGTNFTGAIGVNFGGTPATFTVDSGTMITATSPAGSGTVDITVTTPAGTSASVPVDRFTYV